MQTLQDLVTAFRVYAVCEPCQRMVAVDLAALIARYGPDLALADLRHRLRCTGCSTRTEDVRIIYVGPCGRAGEFRYRR